MLSALSSCVGQVKQWLKAASRSVQSSAASQAVLRAAWHPSEPCVGRNHQHGVKWCHTLGATIWGDVSTVWVGEEKHRAKRLPAAAGQGSGCLSQPP